MATMNNDTLLDYLLSELDADEVRSVENELRRSPSLRKDLAEIQKVLGKVSLLDEDIEPPVNLVQKTLGRVFASAGSAIPVNADDAPAVPDEVILFPLIKTIEQTAERTAEKCRPLSPHRLSRRTPSVRTNAPPVKPVSVEREIKHTHKRLHYAEMLVSVAVGILIALFVFPVISFVGSQIHTYVTQNRTNKINKSFNTYVQLAEMQTPQRPPEETAQQTETAAASLTNSNWQEVVPARIPLLNVGTGSNISVLPSDNETTLYSNSPPSTVYLVSSPEFQDTETNVPPQSSAAQNLPEILYRGQPPEKIERVELNQHDLDYQALMSRINGTVLLTNSQQSNPNVQAVAGQSILIQNGRMYFRQLPAFHPQGR
ncbi:MAG: hypothetical protein FWE67_07035 [Planctomycetaceae bacterium]|nr:hypothetical protein [Planctomycetaceae bacterium]